MEPENEQQPSERHERESRERYERIKAASNRPPNTAVEALAGAELFALFESDLRKAEAAERSRSSADPAPLHSESLPPGDVFRQPVPGDALSAGRDPDEISLNEGFVDDEDH